MCLVLSYSRANVIFGAGSGTHFGSRVSAAHLVNLVNFHFEIALRTNEPVIWQKFLQWEFQKLFAFYYGRLRTGEFRANGVCFLLSGSSRRARLFFERWCHCVGCKLCTVLCSHQSFQIPTLGASPEGHHRNFISSSTLSSKQFLRPYLPDSSSSSFQTVPFGCTKYVISHIHRLHLRSSPIPIICIFAHCLLRVGLVPSLVLRLATGFVSF